MSTPSPAGAAGESARAVVSLAMYPYPSLRVATDEWWSVIRRHLGWGPSALEWSILTPHVWRDPQLLLAQACGWPLVTELAGSVTVVGTFDYDVPGAERGTYRSVIVSHRQATIAELSADHGCVVAVNGVDSLSGWISLRAAWGGAPSTIIETGAHLDSVRAVATGRADVASIDAVSWALLAALHPRLAARLHVVGAGPRVPCLPLVTGPLHSAAVAELRLALAAAVVDPAGARALGALRIRGFVPLDLADYLPLRSLAP